MSNADLIAATEAQYEGVTTLDYEEHGIDHQTTRRCEDAE